MISFGLVIEYNKLKIFYFSKVYNNFNLKLNLLYYKFKSLKYSNNYMLVLKPFYIMLF